MWLAHFKYMTDCQLTEFTNRLAVELLAAAKQRNLTALIPNLVNMIDCTKHTMEEADQPIKSTGWKTDLEVRL